MGGLPWPADPRADETPDNSVTIAPHRQRMIAASVAGGLCGAAIATAGLLIVQAAVFHSSCSTGPAASLDASSSLSRPATPPEPPYAPT